MSNVGMGEPFTEAFFETLMSTVSNIADVNQAGFSDAEKLADSCIAFGALQMTVLGGILLYLEENQFVADNPAFGQYCNKRFGLRPKNARYLIQIFNWVRSANHSYSQVIGLGVSKLRLLERKIAPEAMIEMIEFASNATYPELRKQLGKSKEPVEDGSKWSARRFVFAPDQSENIEAAIQQAKEMAGTKYDSVALDLICTQFRTDPGFPTIERVRQYLKSIGPDATSDLVKSADPGDDFD